MAQNLSIQGVARAPCFYTLENWRNVRKTVDWGNFMVFWHCPTLAGCGKFFSFLWFLVFSAFASFLGGRGWERAPRCLHFPWNVMKELPFKVSGAGEGGVGAYLLYELYSF